MEGLTHESTCSGYGVGSSLPGGLKTALVLEFEKSSTPLSYQRRIKNTSEAADQPKAVLVPGFAQMVGRVTTPYS